MLQSVVAGKYPGKHLPCNSIEPDVHPAPAKDDDMHLTIGRGLLNLPDAGKLQ
jgi:hypothetical protein